ncbi:hypothetical protein HanRHA438_Chr10g0474871 [Helianthus annuus]|nr:hypothetical protein HanRHA438_Chr10g0474871 [Helianthus annuus]
MVQNPSSSSATTGTTSVLGTEAKWEGNVVSFDYDEVNAQWVENPSSASATAGTTCLLGSGAEWEGYARSFDYDEGSDVLNRTCDDIVENPNGSASATAGMIKAQVGAIFNYFGRKAQVKRKRPCEDLGESSSATAAASGTEAQVTEEDEEFFTKNRHPYDVYPYPDIVYQYEGTRLVQKVFFPPSRLNYVRLVKRRGPITPEEAAIKEPYYHHLVASGWGGKVKPMGKQWLARLS